MIADFIRTYVGYILFSITLIAGIVKELLNSKQKKVIRLEAEASIKETEINAKKANLDYTEALRDSYRETAAEWKTRYDEEKVANLDLIKANKICLDNFVREQKDKAAYLEEIHKLREEVKELKAMILRFQEKFPDLFLTFSDNITKQ